MAVHLTRIYTKTGDDGTHRPRRHEPRCARPSPRLGAYADVDEANSSLGVVLALGAPADGGRRAAAQVQNDLFDVGADLCTPVVPDPEYPPLRVTADYTARLEQACDTYNARLEKLSSFILPGGTPAAALLHVARTVVRRAERSTWALLEAEPDTHQPGAGALPQPAVGPAVHPVADRQPGRRRPVAAGRRAG